MKLKLKIRLDENRGQAEFFYLVDEMRVMKNNRQTVSWWRSSLFGAGLWLCLLGLALLDGGAAAARSAPEPAVSEVVVTNSHHDLLLYFRVTDAITPEMEAGLKSGLPLTFTFFVELVRQRSGWLDQRLAALEFDHHLSYDNLKDEYRVERRLAGEPPRTTASLLEAGSLMSRVDGLVLLPLAELEPDQHYTVRIKVRLAEKGLPFAVHRLLPFRRLRSFETDWHSVQFSY